MDKVIISKEIETKELDNKMHILTIVDTTNRNIKIIQDHLMSNVPKLNYYIVLTLANSVLLILLLIFFIFKFGWWKL